MRHESNNVMKTVRIDKAELLAIVISNRAKHVSEYAEAVNDYIAAVNKVAQENLDIARTNDFKSIKDKSKDYPQAPESYETSYSRAIRMLELSADSVIELEAQVFNQLVLDEWHWKQHFTINASSLKAY